MRYRHDFGNSMFETGSATRPLVGATCSEPRVIHEREEEKQKHDMKDCVNGNANRTARSNAGAGGVHVFRCQRHLTFAPNHNNLGLKLTVGARAPARND